VDRENPAIVYQVCGKYVTPTARGFFCPGPVLLDEEAHSAANALTDSPDGMLCRRTLPPKRLPAGHDIDQPPVVAINFESLSGPARRQHCTATHITRIDQ